MEPQRRPPSARRRARRKSRRGAPHSRPGTRRIPCSAGKPLPGVFLLRRSHVVARRTPCPVARANCLDARTKLLRILSPMGRPRACAPREPFLLSSGSSAGIDGGMLAAASASLVPGRSTEISSSSGAADLLLPSTGPSGGAPSSDSQISTSLGDAWADEPLGFTRVRPGNRISCRSGAREGVAPPAACRRVGSRTGPTVGASEAPAAAGGSSWESAVKPKPLVAVGVGAGPVRAPDPSDVGGRAAPSGGCAGGKGRDTRFEACRGSSPCDTSRTKSDSGGACGPHSAMRLTSRWTASASR